MKDVLICVDMDHDPDKTGGAPVVDGDKDAPIWALYSVAGSSEDWAVKFHRKGLTYQEADDLANELGLAGRRIG